LNFVIAAIIFKEPTELLQIFGYAVIFFSIVLFNWARLKSMLN
jgi:EamA domain-containing membrane protein RarD